MGENGQNRCGVTKMENVEQGGAGAGELGFEVLTADEMGEGGMVEFLREEGIGELGEPGAGAELGGLGAGGDETPVAEQAVAAEEVPEQEEVGEEVGEEDTGVGPELGGR